MRRRWSYRSHTNRSGALESRCPTVVLLAGQTDMLWDERIRMGLYDAVAGIRAVESNMVIGRFQN